MIVPHFFACSSYYLLEQLKTPGVRMAHRWKKWSKVFNLLCLLAEDAMDECSCTSGDHWSLVSMPAVLFVYDFYTHELTCALP